MSATSATAYRRAAARISYMAQDRGDLAFVAGHLASRMACPLEGDEAGIKRALRYLIHRPVCPLLLPVQEPVSGTSVWVDSDWASDEVTRRSVSGGTVRRGTHTVAWWSRRQARVALSSCEAELNAMVKGMAEGLLLNEICAFFSEPGQLEIHTDSSAARGVVMRTGSGKLKHLSTKQLWIQEYVSEGSVVVTKVPREDNAADAFTHAWTSCEGRFFHTLGFRHFSPA